MTRPKKKAARKPVEPDAKKRSELLTEDRKTKLGMKHVCFSCSAKFYDLNKPEPVCPKCGVDQRTRPKGSDHPAPPPPPPKKAPPRPMPASLLEEEEEAVPFEEDMDLDLGEIGAGGDGLFEEDADAGETVEDESEEP